MPFRINRNDITKVEADTIVNTTYPIATMLVLLIGKFIW